MRTGAMDVVVYTSGGGSPTARLARKAPERHRARRANAPRATGLKHLKAAHGARAVCLRPGPTWSSVARHLQVVCEDSSDAFDHLLDVVLFHLVEVPVIGRVANRDPRLDALA